MTFTTLEFLRASSARGLEDRASGSSLHAWSVECACCRPRAGGRLTLRLREDYRDGPAHVSCLNGCSEAAILSAVGLGDRLSSEPLLAPVAAEQAGRRRTLLPYDVDRMALTVPPALTLSTYGHLIAECADAGRIDAEQEITKARAAGHPMAAGADRTRDVVACVS